MQRVIAYCSDIDQLHEERILDVDFCRRVPCSTWLPILAPLIAAQEHRLTTGAIANGPYVATEIIVIAAEVDGHVDKSQNQGALGGIFRYVESTLLTQTIYARICAHCLRCWHWILFKETIYANFPDNTHGLRCPISS
jgi:hypothetical protein